MLTSSLPASFARAFKGEVIIKNVVLGALALISTAGSAQAAIVSVDFSGKDVILNSDTVNGSVEYDSTATPYATIGTSVADYEFLNNDLTFTVAGDLVNPGTYSNFFSLRVWDNVDFGNNVVFDLLWFRSPLESGNGSANLFLYFDRARFAGTALPTDLTGATTSLFQIDDRTLPLGGLDFQVTYTTRVGSGAVPEPATWAMMIAGIGLVGVTARRRRSKASFAAA